LKNRLFFSLLVPVLACGCSRIPGKLLIMEANYRNSRGMYTQAISSYLKALEYEESTPYAEYGLGSVYFTMGEDKAALDRFTEAGKMLKAASPSGNRELSYRIHYNTGVVLFSKGDYSGAADSFREALRSDGGKIEAKRNLELSMKSLARDNMAGSGGGSENENRALLFEYLGQKELDRWRDHEWPEEPDTGEPDY